MRRLRIVITAVAVVVGTLALFPSPAGATTVQVADEQEYRDAITALSADGSGPHTIQLTESITLTSAIDPDYTGTQPLTIDGDGFKLDGGDNSRVLEAFNSPVTPITIQNVIVTNARNEGTGTRKGGAITTNAPLTVRNAEFSNNHAVSTDGSASGGAIQVTETEGAPIDVLIEDSEFAQNEAEGVTFGGGGAIVVGGVGDLTITNTDFVANTAEGTAGNATGAGLQGNAATTTVTGSSFVDGLAEGVTGEARGGAVTLTVGQSMDVLSSTFSSNRALGPETAAGGAISLTTASAANLTVEDSVLVGNKTTAATNIAEGGALRISSIDTEISGSLISDNSASSSGLGAWGGGVSFFTADPGTRLTIADSAVVDNTAGGSTADTTGGGVRAFLASGSAPLTVRNSTVSGNSSSSPTGKGGGLWASGMVLDHVTVAANASATQANIGDGSPGSSTSFRRTVFAEPLGGGSNCGLGVSVSDGYNADDDGSCLLDQPGDLSNVDDALLGQARDNGDLVAAAESGEAGGDSTVRPTMFPLNGSPLIDAIPAESCSALPELDPDQRGVDRPFGAGCDIGAIEAVFPAHGFSDVTPFYEATVRWITSPVNTPNILDGYDDGTFRQTLNITRGQVARMYHRAAGEPTGAPHHGFDDVIPFYDAAVSWAKAEGIFDGFDDNTFRHADPISRGNFIRSLYGLAQGDLLGDPGPHGFGDVTPFYENAVRWAKANGLADGFSADNTFRQKNNITRGNTTRITYNLARTPTAWGDTMAAPDNMVFKDNLTG